MVDFKIGDLVYVPFQGHARYLESINYIFVVTRFINKDLIVIGKVDIKKKIITHEYIVFKTEIRLCEENKYKRLSINLVDNGYLRKYGEGYFDIIHSDDSSRGYLPIYGIDSIVAFKEQTK